MARGGKQRRRQAATEGDFVTTSLRLVVLSGEQIGRRVVLQRGVNVVGRDESCHVQFDNPKLSRRHAELVEVQPHQYAVRDLGSQNGTFVNGAAVVAETLCRIGDKIRFGSDLVVHVAVHDPLEEQVRQRQRFEALGRATAGIAHDFNNLLSAVIANVGYLERLDGKETLAHPDVAACLDDVQTAAERAAQLSDRLVHFARGERARDVPVDVGEMCAEVAQLVRRTFDRTITVKTACAENLTVIGDGLELHQVLMNLCINARDAMPQGGTLTLSARRGEEDGVLISVADSGEGMTESTRAQIFHPFFTTKNENGYGLGLATVHEIVRSLGGDIVVDSRLGEGTRFDITLPAALGESVTRVRVDSAPPIQVEIRPLRVLVVDDEAAVRRSTQRVLSQAGHDVADVATGAEALERYATMGRPDVVLLDVDMPGLSGAETLRLLRVEDPTAVVVMMSGIRDRAAERDLRQNGAAGFLRKPASTNQILASLAQAAQGNETDDFDETRKTLS